MKRLLIAFTMVWVMVAHAQDDVVDNIFISDNKITIIDVRTDKEYKEGHLENAINIPYDEIKEKIKEHITDKNEKILLYCRSGRRSGIAEEILKDLGYKNVINAGAYEELKKKQEKRKDIIDKGYRTGLKYPAAVSEIDMNCP